eukprot:scaffold848_cov247-Pinguiococcus_pyrenoidosus.AAC.16
MARGGRVHHDVVELGQRLSVGVDRNLILRRRVVGISRGRQQREHLGERNELVRTWRGVVQEVRKLTDPELPQQFIGTDVLAHFPDHASKLFDALLRINLDRVQAAAASECFRVDPDWLARLGAPSAPVHA